MKTFHGFFPDGTDYDESNFAKVAAESFQAELLTIGLSPQQFIEDIPTLIWAMDEPAAGPGIFPQYRVSKMAAGHVKVVLGGQGGDELFGGYTFRYKKFLQLTNNNSTTEEKIISYLNCHERDWVPDQELIFSDECKFSWNEIHEKIRPYFSNSLSNFTQVLLADYNGKLLHNMQPLYSLIHKHFGVTNITPIQNNETIRLSCQLTDSLKYDFSTNTGKIPLVDLIEKYGLTNLISQEKQGFSVNTVNMWSSYGQKIFLHYFDKSRLTEDKILNSDWIQKYSNKSNLDVRYVNKLLGILALEIWYRLFIIKDLHADEKLTI